MAELSPLAWGIILAYFVIVVLVGEYARRRSKKDREGYFMASRSFKTIALFFSLLATIVTAFAAFGGPSMAYRNGIATFGLIGAILALTHPLMASTVAYRFWLAGKKFKHLTPGQFLNHRYESNILGPIISTILIFWTIPYVLLGAIAGGTTFETMTGGLVPYWGGVGAVLLIILIYVFTGGMRGTTWTNIIQGAIMLLFLNGFIFLLASKFGGFTAATQATLSAHPDFASRAASNAFSTPMWVSWALIDMAFIMFPHAFIRYLTGNSAETLRRLVLLIPAGMVLVWAPVSLIGFWGAGQVPGLTGAAADSLLPILIKDFMPLSFIGLGIVVMLAAAMSSLDAQVLTIGTLIPEDFLRAWKPGMSERREIFITRGILSVVTAIVFGLAIIRPGTIIDIGAIAISGLLLLLYPTVVGLYHKKMTEKAVLAGILFGFAGVWAFHFGWIPSWLTFGYMNFVPILVVQIPLVHLVARFTSPPSTERVLEYFDLFKEIW